MTRTGGRMWFDEDGGFNTEGVVPVSHQLRVLSAQLKLFLARMDSCERTPDGDHRLSSSTHGPLGGAEVLWARVSLLSASLMVHGFRPLTAEQAAERDDSLKRTNVWFPDDPRSFQRNALPLVDVLRDISGAILANEVEGWRGIIPSATILRIHRLAVELDIHLAALKPTAQDPDAQDSIGANPLTEKSPRVAQPEDPPDTGEYQPASWFPKSIRGRLRHAANPSRETKRVKRRKVDGVVVYSVADASQWWPKEVPRLV